MKNLFLFLALVPLFLMGNDENIPSEIKEVTVYLSGAQITRTALCKLPEGTSEIVLSGLSTKIDENSIQISGLQSVSILAMRYDINYMPIIVDEPSASPLEDRLERIEEAIGRLKNQIAGLEEEAEVIYSNRTVSTRIQGLSLEKVKEISTYYRERITAIKNGIFNANLKIKGLNEETRTIQNQLAELNNTPEKEQGELKITFDAPVASTLNLLVSYQVEDAGWVPNYDIKSEEINAPLKLTYKAHVYQKTGNDWTNVKITLSTGNPTLNVAKPHLGTKYLNFTNGYQTMTRNTTKKKRYVYNPSVKTVTGTVLDESGAPLPGANIVVKGTSNGTQADFDGHFSLDVEKGEELSVSYVGFDSTVLPIYSSVMNIRLDEDTRNIQALDEVVVIGYGTQTKREYTSAVTTVNAEQILAKRTPGVRIRGISSVKDKSPSIPTPKPLYVIDGIPVSNFQDGDLDMDEIQSVEVLKGAQTAAIYGTQASNGVILITTKKSTLKNDVTHAKFVIKKAYSVPSDGDITAIEINTFKLDAQYEYFAAPIINENVFLTSRFTDWERYNLLPGEASIYFKGGYAGKTSVDPYTTKKEMTISLGIDPNITVMRKQNKNFKSKSFTGSSRILDRNYDLEVKNNKAVAIDLKLVDRIPISQNKEIRIDAIETNNGSYDVKKGLLHWNLKLSPQETKTESFSFQVRYPKHKRITI